MVRSFMVCVVWLACALPASAQPLTGLARLDGARSSVTESAWRGTTTVELALSLGVPFRVFTLDAPPRLVLDFSEVDFEGVTPADVLPAPGAVTAVRFGPFAPGWSRFVADLARPMVPSEVDLAVDDPAGGAALLRVTLSDATTAEFAAASGVPESTGWSSAKPQSPARAQARTDPAPFTIVLDPGHGGLDPGAERDGLVEKDLVLDFARVLADVLRREGVRVVMTREDDSFVSLQARTGRAHQAGASVFVSIHADALSKGGARGATVYTLSERASDAASAQLAARHNRADILAGVDLTGADDEVTSVLLDLSRRETEPRTEALADAIVAGMAAAGGPMNRKPRRQAGFSVLKSADIPSVLVEIGFLSDARDRKNLADPDWRSVLAAGLADALLAWRDADAARADLVRQ